VKCPFVHVTDFAGEPIIATPSAGELSAIKQVMIFAASLDLQTALRFVCPRCNGNRWFTNSDGRYCRGDNCRFAWPDKDDDKYFTLLEVHSGD